ncbi:tropomyosin-2-like [Anabas testudineus]|uniref:tropomyosin-2-like n=1 Tax=Anabas testudineus TaxID=64144 RepID=UPI00143D095C|nr:tropomyosin-2-like [Anabas testudineus]
MSPTSTLKTQLQAEENKMKEAETKKKQLENKITEVETQLQDEEQNMTEADNKTFLEYTIPEMKKLQRTEENKRKEAEEKVQNMKKQLKKLNTEVHLYTQILCFQLNQLFQAQEDNKKKLRP